ncbi:MAG: hypothetical protein ACXABY_28900, partial [Candidatus Thorarchaeota archaeon]|jgi:hypothetical protein
VEHHLAPQIYPHVGTKSAGYRRLHRKLVKADVSPRLLACLGKADRLGRGKTKKPDTAWDFLEQMEDAIKNTSVEFKKGPRDVVTGKHLIYLGYKPGPNFTEMLHECRDIQDETGETDAVKIIQRWLNCEI